MGSTEMLYLASTLNWPGKKYKMVTLHRERAEGGQVLFRFHRCPHTLTVLVPNMGPGLAGE